MGNFRRPQIHSQLQPGLRKQGFNEQEQDWDKPREK